MSRTELHIGKLRKVEFKQIQSLEDFCKNKFETLRLIKELPITKDSWVEYFKEEFFVIIPNEIHFSSICLRNV